MTTEKKELHAVYIVAIIGAIATIVAAVIQRPSRLDTSHQLVPGSVQSRDNDSAHVPAPRPESNARPEAPSTTTSQPSPPQSERLPRQDNPAPEWNGPLEVASRLLNEDEMERAFGELYPTELRARSIRGGCVGVSYTVGADGVVRNARVERSNAPPELEAKALEFVRRHRYYPRLRLGKPVESEIYYPVAFVTSEDPQPCQRSGNPR